MAIDVSILGERIKILREKKGWSVSKLAAESGLDTGQLGKLERGVKPNLTVVTINRLAAALEVSANRLMDESELEELVLPEKKTDKLLELKRVFDRIGLKELSFVGEILQMPVRGYVRAGSMCLSEHEEDEPLILPRGIIEGITSQPDSVYALRVVGESLSGDGIHENDHILIIPTSTLDIEGKIYIIRDPNTGESVVKHLNHKNSHISVTSSNRKYPPLVLSQVEIIGRVVYIQPQGKAV